jgi:hypothetical protein
MTQKINTSPMVTVSGHSSSSSLQVDLAKF